MNGLQLAIGESTLAAYLLALARTAGFVLVAPPFNTKAVPGRIRAGVAVALAIPLTTPMATTSPRLDSTWVLLQMVAQLVMGLTLGYLVLAAVATIESIGTIIDMVGGFQMSMGLDPLSLVQTSVMGRLHQLLAVTLLFGTDGHLMVLQGLSRSAQAMPVPAMSWGDVSRAVTSAASGVMLGAIQVAAPVMAAMLVVDVTLGLLTRVAPALNAFALGFPVKVLFTTLLGGLIVARVPGVLSTVIRRAVLTGWQLYGGG